MFGYYVSGLLVILSTSQYTGYDCIPWTATSLVRALRGATHDLSFFQIVEWKSYVALVMLP